MKKENLRFICRAAKRVTNLNRNRFVEENPHATSSCSIRS
jgi:hypothetical protein